MGHAAAAFAMPLAKISLLAGGQAEVPDRYVSRVQQTNPHPLAYCNKKMGVWDLSSLLLTTKVLTSNIQ